MYCPVCGKEMYDNGETRFGCPFCGAEVMAGGATADTEEDALRARCRWLELELARQQVKAAIEKQSAAEHFWFGYGNPFAMLYRQSARNALERGDFELAKRYLAKAKRVLYIGFVVYVVLILIAFVAVFAAR